MLRDAFFKIFEKVYVIVAFLYFAGALFTSHVAEGDLSQRQNSDIFKIFLQLALFGILAVLILIHKQTFLAGVRSSGWIMALSLFAILSSAWSADHAFSLRRALILFAMTCFAIYVGSRFDLDEFLDAFAWAFVLVIAASLFVVIFFPGYGISQDIHAGDWIGLFVHKNILGLQMVLALFTLGTGKPASMPTILRYWFIACALVLLMFSRSAASLIALLFLLSVYPLSALLRLPRRPAITVGALAFPIAAVGTALVVTNLDSALQVLGRNATLTGRIPLWNAVLDSIREKPWLGYGYGSFWRLPGGEAQTVIARVHWFAPHAHNGFLDLCLDVGLVGLALFACGLFVAYWRAIRTYRLSSGLVERWPLFFLLLLTIYNFAESHLMRLLSTLWIPYAATYVCLSLALARQEATEVAQEWTAASAPAATSLPGTQLAVDSRS